MNRDMRGKNQWFAGFNVMEHAEIIAESWDTIGLQAPLLIVMGILTGVVLYAGGVFSYYAQMVNAAAQAAGSPDTLHEYTLFTMLYLPFMFVANIYFLRDVFAPQFRGEWRPFLMYAWRMLKATFAIGMFLLVIVGPLVLVNWYYVMPLLRSGLTVTSGVVGALSTAATLGICFYLLRFIISFAFWGMPLMLRGHSFFKAYRQALDAFSGCWKFLVSLWLLVMIISSALNHGLPLMLPHATHPLFWVVVGPLLTSLPNWWMFLVFAAYYRRQIKA